QKIENLLKARRFISNALVYGDQQKYLVALLTVDPAEVKKWARGESIDFESIDDFVSHRAFHAEISAEIKKMNQELPSYETLKKFRILSKDFTVEDGELTPSLKLKRKII